MAQLLFADSFDHWDENDPLTKYNYGTDFNNWRVSASYGRHGAGIRMNTGGTQPNDAVQNNGNATLSQRKYFDLKDAAAIACMGCAFKLVEGNIPGNGWPFLQFLDSSTQKYWLGAFDATQCAVWLLPSNRISLVRGDFQSPTTLATSTATFKPHIWHYLEFQLSVVGGTAVVKLDGQTIINFSGITKATSQTRLDGFRIGYNRSGSFNQRLIQIDDVYVTDGGFLGDVKVELRRPTVDGANQGWTPSAGTLHYDMVNDLTPDESNTYVEGAVGEVDTYTTEDLVITSGAVKGIHICNYAHDPEMGSATKTLQSAIRHAGANYFGTSGTIGTTTPILGIVRTYMYNMEGYLTDPGTGSAYDIAGFAEDEYGFKRST